MEKRVFVVLDKQKELSEVASKLASDLAKLPDSHVVVARSGSRAGEALPEGSQLLTWPDELKTDPAIRNFVNQSAEAKMARFLHVVDGSTEIQKDPSEFLDQLEKTMDVLDYSFWLATSCDPCNYLYQKFCPRVVVDVDDPKYEKYGLKQIVLTSHSNLQWVAYDLEKASESELKLDEDFSIAMYEIIEALARRKAQKKTQPYFMNQYVTVPAETGVFRASRLARLPELDQTALKREDEIFKSKNIQHAADNAVDEILLAIKTKLDEKTA